MKSKITVIRKEATEAAKSKQTIFKNSTPFTDCITQINNTQVENAKYLDIVMPLYNSLEHSDNYAITLVSLRQYYRHEPADNIIGNTGAVNVNIAVPYKY